MSIRGPPQPPKVIDPDASMRYDGTLSATTTSVFASTFGLTASEGHLEQEAVAQALAATLTLRSPSPAAALLPPQHPAPALVPASPTPPTDERRDRRRGANSRRNKQRYALPPDFVSTVDGLPQCLPMGTKLRFFNPTEEVAYCGPSEHVLATKGVLDHLDELHRDGPRAKAKLYLCTTFERNGRCLNGALCREVHPQLEASGAISSAIATMTVHRRSSSPNAYPRLPSGVTFRLSLPNTAQPCHDVASESIFMTQGAWEFFQLVSSGRESRMNMQHCAHFSKNGMCCYGPDCQFVHVAGYTPTERREDPTPVPIAHGRTGRRRPPIATGGASRLQGAAQAAQPPREADTPTPAQAPQAPPPLQPMPYMFLVPQVVPWQVY